MTPSDFITGHQNKGTIRMICNGSTKALSYNGCSLCGFSLKKKEF